MTDATKTPEQLAAEAAAAAQAKADAAAQAKAQKEQEKAAKAQAKAAEKQKKEEEKLAKKNAAEAEKKAKADAKAAAAATKAAEKQAKVDAKSANQMPEQNGVRRPKPDTLCGRAWAAADKLSAQLGQPVPIAVLLKQTNEEGLNEGNVKAEYARWRKFNGVIGRVALPAAAAPAGTEAGQAPV